MAQAMLSSAFMHENTINRNLPPQLVQIELLVENLHIVQ
jgi:hypothetical protein